MKWDIVCEMHSTRGKEKIQIYDNNDGKNSVHLIGYWF